MRFAFVDLEVWLVYHTDIFLIFIEHTRRVFDDKFVDLVLQKANGSLGFSLVGEIALVF